MKNPHDIDVSLSAYAKASAGIGHRMLLAWLSDDGKRAQLFSQLHTEGRRSLRIWSRDAAPRECHEHGLELPRAAAVPGHVPVTLVVDRSEIQQILTDQSGAYSNRVYAELGGGSFMLALDPSTGAAHTAQRLAFGRAFPRGEALLHELAHRACQDAGVMAFRAPDFDLADFAEQAALRFCQLLMGYPTKDFGLLESALRAGYRALVHQVFERHFVTDPVVIPEARLAMGRLLARTSALIDGFATEDEDVIKGWQEPLRPPGLGDPVLKRLADYDCDLNGEQRATLALGAAVGTVGNAQAAACIAVSAIFADARLRRTVRDLALSECMNRRTSKAEAWRQHLVMPLRENPPIPYLPRIKVDVETGEKQEELLLALGGGAATLKGADVEDDPLIWGFPDTAPHWCAGQALAWPLIIEIVRHVMALPNLAQALDPVDGSVVGLKKRHGFACERYPLTHRRDRWRTQSSLNVAMRIRAPVHENAARLRGIIRAGAPRIEQALRESNHVHFAWFEFIEQDTVLVLHTVYDGPFGAYLQHFARRAGDLFDVLFECIEDPPPMPVDKFPTEFAAHLLRYNRPPAMGYFFSAYPGSEVARILRQEGRGP